MAHRRSERGEGRLGCIFWALLLIVGVIIAWVAVPVKIKSSELYDFMVDQATFASQSRDSEAMKRAVLRRAKELDLPLDAKRLTVKRTESRIQMTADYTVPLEFPFDLTYEWKFHHEVDRPIFYY